MVRWRPEPYKTQCLAPTVEEQSSPGVALAGLGLSSFVFVKDTLIKVILEDHLLPSALTMFTKTSRYANLQNVQ